MDRSEAVEEWTAYGVRCCIVPGGVPAFNGYVQIPPELPLGRETVEDVMDSHGGVNYGPDDDGWIGFDTAHLRDYWAPDDLISHFDDALAMQFAAFQREMAERNGGGRRWTMAKLRTETEKLAQQVAVALDLSTGIEEPTFTCPRCEATSHHPKDVEFGYCGACHDFTLRKV